MPAMTSIQEGSGSCAAIPSTPIERRQAADLSYDSYMNDYVAKNRPVVIEGAVREWPALSKWTPDYFKSQFGSRLVDVSYAEKMTFADFVDAVMASTDEIPGPYMFRLFIGPHMPELLDDLTPMNAYAFPRRFASALMPQSWRRPDGYLKLLFGGVGGKFPVMHFDGENVHASITEIYGDKEFIVYAPEDTAYLYPSPNLPNQSQIDNIVDPDYNRFPLFRQATRFRTVLHPGEMIFVPSRWWHTARVLSPSISVCQNILDRSNWSGYVTEVCGPLTAQLPPLKKVKRLAKTAYFTGLGIALTALELGPGHISGASTIRKSRIARLAPINSQEAIDVSDWQVHKWVVR